MMDADKAIREYDRGTITYDQLKAQFEQATYAVRQPTEGGWDKVWQRADDGPDGTDVPGALNRAGTSGAITAAQETELMDIYEAKVRAQV